MEKIIVKLENNEENQCKLFHYLEKTDEDFNIPLSTRVDLLEYAKKMLQKGIVIAAFCEDEMVGIMGFYCNSEETSKGYITIASLTKRAQMEGYNVRDFFHACNLIALKKGIKEFYVEAVDRRAALLYKRMGFTEICQEKNGDVIHYHLVIDIEDWMLKDAGRQVIVQNWEE